VKEERTKVNTRDAKDGFGETAEVLKNSRFSSGKRSSSSIYSEGIRMADASRLNNISKPFFDGLIFVFTAIHPGRVGGRSTAEWIELDP